jgi:CBS domain-containing protein
MKTVREVIHHKGSIVYTISPKSTVYEALQHMADKNIGALIVSDNNRVEGIISERDYARKVILSGKVSKDICVEEIMSSTIFYVGLDSHIDECMAIMINKHIRHLPVMEEGKLLGIISIGDVVKAVIDEKEFVIDQLLHYISGRPA